MTDGRRRGLGPLAIVALLALANTPALASSFDCTTNTGTSALSTFLQTEGEFSFDTVTVTGTCNGPLFVPPNITLTAASMVGSTISGPVTFGGRNITMTGFVIDGTNSGVGSIAVNIQGGNVVTLSTVTVQNWIGSTNGAVSVTNGGNLTMTGSTINANSPTGGGSYYGLFIGNDGSATISNTTITGNTLGGVEMIEGKASFILDNITSNPLSAIVAIQSDLRIIGGTVAGSTAGTDTSPTIVLTRSSLIVALSADISGTNHSPTIYATPTSTVRLYTALVTNNDASDPTILMADGSTLLSDGGNTITNSASNGIAITVSNASTFQERNETNEGFPQLADAITGGGSIFMQSNAEIGTGPTSPSTWTTGSQGITAAQNSAFRMDGGMTITGGVKLSQGSNGFFNPGVGGQNIVTSGVTCPFSTTQSAHVSGNTFVLLSSGGASAVTIGSAAGNCLGF